MSDCARGQHDLKPRYDIHRVGEIAERKYVCDICVKCGHTVPRATPIEMLNAGLITTEEALALSLNTGPQ